MLRCFSKEQQIAKKVQDVLSKTPLEILPRRELPRCGQFKDTGSGQLIDLDLVDSHNTCDFETKELQPQETNNQPTILEPTTDVISGETNMLTSETIKTAIEHKLTFDSPDMTPSKSHQNQEWDLNLKQTNSLEILTPSPLGFAPFDSRSLDELMTPDEFGSDQLVPGLSNINYDIDLSDFSGDNSVAEDTPKEPKDCPFKCRRVVKLYTNLGKTYKDQNLIY